MTVARAAQDEVEEVKKEMQEMVKASQEASDTQVERGRERVWTRSHSCLSTGHLLL